ncbi:MAG: gamma-glutamylcyclotransferase [Kofleriaceae bacterium]|nr:gamma-glutamylcyclotransferase [Kofleriaceae bacterium]
MSRSDRTGAAGATGSRRTRPNPTVDRLFVYGTLRQGQTARAVVMPHVDRWEPATTPGRIYAFPMGYPGLVDGDGVVVGELCVLTELAAALALLDAFEGADFVRMLRQVTCADGRVETAWVYQLADPTTADRYGEHIPDGDWVAFWRRALGSGS